MSDWVEYTASKEQIKELNNSRNGVLLELRDGKTSIVTANLGGYDFIRYWIIPDDPLRKMKIRQAETGQPVWVRYLAEASYPTLSGRLMEDTQILTIITTAPNWEIPNAEYRFTPFEEIK